MVRAWLRAMAERAARGKVVRRRLPAAFGGLPIHVSPDARSGFRPVERCPWATVALPAAWETKGRS
jgi:hypothetical protein